MSAQSMADQKKLDAAPLREWLRDRVHEHGSILNTARAWGVSERQLRTVLDARTRRVTLALADRMLTREDAPERLGDLWPELDER